MPLPDAFRSTGRAPVEKLWCPAPTDFGTCGQPLGTGDCSLCVAHKQFWQHERNLHQKLVCPPADFCKFLQLDRCLYSFDLAVEPTFQYQLREAHQVLDGQLGSYTFEQWACHWIVLATSAMETQGFLPLPKSGKLPFELPDLLRSEPSLHNCGFTLSDTLLRENIYLADFFACAIADWWNYNQKDFIEDWSLAMPAKVDIPTCNMIPWDSLVAASAISMIQEAEQLGCTLSPSGWTRDFADYIRGSFLDEASLWFQAVDEFERWMFESEYLSNIFLGADVFSNTALKGLSSFASCFTDLAFWQLAFVFGRLSHFRSQLQVPNDSLVSFWNDVAKSSNLNPECLQAAINRHWNNKGNSMETLLYLLAEGGNHLLFWQIEYVLFMDQHKDVGQPWVVSVH